MALPKISLFPQPLDARRVYTITILDGNRQPVVGAYSGLEPLSAAIWAGRGTAPLATPAAAWADPTNAIIHLIVTPSDLAGLLPGTYRLAVTIAPGVQDVPAFDGTIALADAPGSAAARAPYGPFADMLDYAPWAAKIQADADMAGLLNERIEAREWLDGQVMARAERALRESARLLLGRPRVVPILRDAADPSAPAIESGAWWGPSGVPSRTIPAQLLQWRAFLDAGALMTDPAGPDGGGCRRIVAYRALYVACRAQVGGKSPGNLPYAELASGFASEARRRLAAWAAFLDPDLDGVADYRLGA